MGAAGRRTLIGLVVVILLLIVADRVSAHVLAGQIATRAQRTEGLEQKPDVSIDGFPFLTQVISGRYHDVKVHVRGFQQNGPRVQAVDADLKGVHVPFSDGIQGKVREVPVDSVASRVHLTFDDINAYVASQNLPLRAGSSGSQLRVTGPQGLSGLNVRIDVSGDVVTLTPTTFTDATAVGRILAQLGIQAPSLRFPVQGLPFNLHVRTAKVDGDGLTFTAGGTNVVLTNTQATG